MKKNSVEKFSFFGARTMKTVAAVFACFLIDELRTDGLPFFSSIAAVLCVKNTSKESIAIAIDREIATLVGGVWGMVFMAFEYYIHPISPLMLRYLIVSLMLVPLIDICRLLRQSKAVALSCIVYLCIVIAHGEDATPFAFGVARIIDTTIGIAVALTLNFVGMDTKPYEKNFYAGHDEIDDSEGVLTDIASKEITTATDKIINKVESTQAVVDRFLSKSSHNNDVSKTNQNDTNRDTRDISNDDNNKKEP